MGTIPGSFRKQAMSDTAPLTLLFKCWGCVRGGNGEKVTHITSEGTSKPSHIFSSHEEADTKMIFLDWHFIITSKCIGPYTSQLWIHTVIVTATQNKRRYIHVHDISQFRVQYSVTYSLKHMS